MMQRQRKAFSMLMAIFVIILMASISAFVMNLSAKIVHETTTQYQHEQAVILAKSYTELAIMTVMSNDRNGTATCVQDISGIFGAAGNDGTGYDIDVNIAFIGPVGDIANCDATRQLDNPATVGSDELNIIVDVYVKFKDINSLNPSASLWTTYHRRTLQKI